MPQTRVQGPTKGAKKKDGDLKRGHVISNKFRIGTRKASVSGHSMTTEALLALIARGSKYSNNARSVLLARGVDLTPAVAAEAA